MYGLALIAIIAVMGGAIAYTGDKLGTKVGKKKLSIFGLRPKHTSILVTIVTGVLIAAVTLGLMTAVSLDVRTALFGMEELKSQMVFLNNQVSDKNSELEATRIELNDKTTEYIALSDKIKETSLLLNEITVERDLVSDELQDLQTSYDKAQMDLASYQKDIKNLQATKEELDLRVKGLTSARDDLQRDIDSLNTLTANLREGILNMREGTVVFRAGEVLSTMVNKPVRDKRTAEISLTEMIYQTNQLLLDNFAIKDKNLELLWIAQADFDSAAEELSLANKDMIVRISTLGNTIYGEPVIGHIDLFPNKLIYKKGQAIYSETFPSATSNKQAEETVLVFLRRVNNEAIENGILPDPLTGTVGSLSGSELFDIVNKVKSQKKAETIELVAVAAVDINTVGPLKIAIRIRNAL